MTVDNNGPAAAAPFKAAKYQNLKNFIAEQEAYEAANQAAAPLTKKQRKALAALNAVSLSAPPPVGETDYISLLMQYRQKHPEATTVYVEEESQTGVFVGGTKGQLCYCEIGESAGHAKMPVDRFPAPGHGIGADGVVPMFPRKKDARQYASKFAVEWLISQRYMPDNLKDVSFPKPKQSQPPPPPAALKADGVNVKTNYIPATQRVATLCHRLGFQAPRYVLVQDPDRPFIFSGHPEFGNDDIPHDVGVVKEVYTKKSTKETIAEEVLVYLTRIDEERRVQRELLMNS